MRFNPKQKSRWKWLLVPVALIIVAGIVGKMTNTNPPTNSAQTAPDEAPELRTRTYRQTPDEVMQAAKQVASEQKTWLKSWRIAQVDTDRNLLAIEVPVLVFTDDLTVDISIGETGTEVDVKSKARVGQGDFGENRRHIAQFLRALDEALKSN